MTRVLVADDDPDIRDLVALRLTMEGHDVSLVDNGLSALEELRSGGFQCAVLDVTMPGLTGVEVVRAARAEPALAAIRLIIMSALSLPSQQALGIAAGADIYLTKPFPMSTLLEQVAGAVVPLTNGHPHTG